MNEFKDAKADYESTPVPPELDSRVRMGIARGRASRRAKHIKKCVGAAAACFALLVASLNIFEPVAAAVSDIPVLGDICQVLTIRRYTDINDDRTVDVEQPSIVGDDFAEKINWEIQQRVDAKLIEGEAVIAEYKEAFLDTGGTEEEWAQRNFVIHVDYEIKYQTGTRVSFVIDSYTSVASAYHEQFYYNLDMASGRELTLADLLGEDWVNICNESIRSQIAGAEDPGVFFDEAAGGFSTVDENTAFYINADGAPVVVFPQASIAVRAMGIVEFICPAPTREG